MLRAGQVELRARDEADVVVLHTELYADIATRARADSRPWIPIPAGSSLARISGRANARPARKLARP